MILRSLFASLPRSRRVEKSSIGRSVRAALAFGFPLWSEHRLALVFQRFLACDFLNRVVFRLHNRFPGAAVFAARFVPIARNPEIDALLASDSPLIIAGGHLGPLFFVLLAIRLRLRGRPVYTLHAERTENGPSCVAFMRHIGIEPVLDDRMAMRTLLRSLLEEPRAVVTVGFDYLAVGSRLIAFLGGTIPVSDGIAYLADQTDAPVIFTAARFDRPWMRIVFEGPLRIDRSLPPRERREALVNSLYRHLEPYVAAAPEQWSEWAHMRPAVR